MRVCSTPQCPATYDGTDSRCPSHRKQADRARGTAAERGYNTRGHKRFRAQVLNRDPICVACLLAFSTVADHYPLSRKELLERGMDANAPEHGRGLCKPCHDTSTAHAQPGGWHGA